MSSTPTPSSPSPTGMARTRRVARAGFWLAAPVALAVGGAGLWATSGRYAETDNAYIQADRVTVAPQVAGRVVEVPVRENQAVKKGDVLFRLDPEPFEIAQARWQAQAESTRGMLTAGRSAYRGAQADLRAATADLENKQRQRARLQDLHAKGLVAQQMLDDADNDVQSAQGKRDSDAAALSKAEGVLGGRPDTPDEQLAGYKLILAQLRQAQLDLDHAVVRAPIDGIVGKTMLQAGDYLTVGQAAMPVVAQNPWVEGNFKETDLTHVAVGQPARVVVDAYPDRTWTAHVASLSPASGAEFSVLPPQNATGNWVKIVQRIPVRLTLDRIDDQDQRDDPILRAGMSATVSIDTGAEHSPWGRWWTARNRGKEGKPVAQAGRTP